MDTLKLFLNAKCPYPYEVKCKLVKEKGSLTPICSLSNRSLSPSLTALTYIVFLRHMAGEVKTSM